MIRRENHIIEEAVISSFISKSINYLNFIPDNKDKFQWLSYIQHFGGHTRLLDFTRSLYIALYFAFEDYHNNDNPVAINRNKLDYKFIRYCYSHNKYNEYINGFLGYIQYIDPPLQSRSAIN